MYRCLKTAEEFVRGSTDPITYDHVDGQIRKFTHYGGSERKTKMQDSCHFYEQLRLKIFRFDNPDSGTEGSSGSTVEEASKLRLLEMLKADPEKRDSDSLGDFPVATTQLRKYQREALIAHLEQRYTDHLTGERKKISFKTAHYQTLSDWDYTLEIPNTPIFNQATCSGKSLVMVIIALIPASWVGKRFAKVLDRSSPDWESTRTLITSPSGGLPPQALIAI